MQTKHMSGLKRTFLRAIHQKKKKPTVLFHRAAVIDQGLESGIPISHLGCNQTPTPSVSQLKSLIGFKRERRGWRRGVEKPSLPSLTMTASVTPTPSQLPPHPPPTKDFQAFTTFPGRCRENKPKQLKSKAAARSQAEGNSFSGPEVRGGSAQGHAGGRAGRADGPRQEIDLPVI